ncbi:MAG: hypothetical protein DCC52_17480 [Chloroflexi bacterium]|nr:MAG: hypothetical protein DCC52_17480 [Chloroflexota bacterium]
MTTQTILPPRAEIAEKYKWNDTSVFADQAAWQAEFDAVTHALTQLKKYHGALASSPQVLADALDEMQALQKRGWQIFLYASMLHAVDKCWARWRSLTRNCLPSARTRSPRGCSKSRV